MASRVPIASLEDVPRPPKGWRKPIPLAVKLQVIVNQRGLAPDGTLLDAILVGIQFDHRPPLHERVYDIQRDETVPPANDINCILALPLPVHRALSGKDLSRMRKTERQRSLENDFRERLTRKLQGEKLARTGSIWSRPFRKRKQ